MTNQRIATVLLAAGQGRRFAGDKLAAKLDGRPVAHHAAAALSKLDAIARIAVVSNRTPPLEHFGFEAVLLEPEGAPLSRSIALGVAAAERVGAGAVLIALADMPLVPEAHFRALFAAFDGDAVASLCNAPMPPAILGQDRFAALKSLSGDRGARTLLAAARCVELDPQYAVDIDTAQDLDDARRYLATARGATGAARPVSAIQRSRKPSTSPP